MRRPWLLGLLLALVSAGIVVALLGSETSGTGAENVGESGPEPVTRTQRAPAQRERPERRCQATTSNPGGTNNYIPDAPERASLGTRHQILGAVVLCLVLVHVAALFAESPQDAWFALSPDGPTRARMALIALIALFGVVFLGALRTRLPLAPGTWRVLHAYLAAVVITLGVAHAVLTDGALDGAGTTVLVALGALGLLGIPAAHVTRTRRARRGP